MLIYTVVVSKDVTDARPDEDPFEGHEIALVEDAGGNCRTVVTRYRRTTDLGWALRYFLMWRKTARSDARYRADFRIGDMAARALDALPHPAGVA